MLGTADRHRLLRRAERRLPSRAAARRGRWRRRASPPTPPTRVLGPAAARLMSALVIVSTFGALNGIILAGPRVYYAMARDGLLVRVGRARSIRGSRRRIARSSCRACGRRCSWSPAPTARSFTRVVYTEWIFFALMAVGLMRAARGARLRARRYRVWGYPGRPDRLRVVCLGDRREPDRRTIPRESVIGLRWSLAGLPVYFVWIDVTPCHVD